MVDIYIRPYKPGDRNDCIAIFKSNIPGYFAESELGHFIAWLDAQDEERPAYSDAIEDDFFVARLDGKIVGCGGFYILRDETKAKLVWGIVEGSLHRKGIGKALLVHRINSIEILYPGYRICMDTTQLSYPFFGKMGFKTEKVEKNYYASGLDKYEMVLGVE